MHELSTLALYTLTGMLSWVPCLPDSKLIDCAKILKGIRSTGIETKSDPSHLGK